jgi:hypothetical protein
VSLPRRFYLYIHHQQVFILPPTAARHHYDEQGRDQ